MFADELFVAGDRQDGPLFVLSNVADPFNSIAALVGLRKAVAEEVGDLRVVGVLDQRGEVVVAVVAEVVDIVEWDAHGGSSFLHLSSGQ